MSDLGNKKALMDAFAMILTLLEILKRNKLTTIDEFDSIFLQVKQMPDMKEVYDKIDELEKNPITTLWGSFFGR